MSAPRPEYMSEYRTRKPEYAERQRRLSRARDRARIEVCANYPDEFDAAYAAHCRKLGVDPSAQR